MEPAAKTKILLIDDDLMSCKLVVNYFSAFYEVSYILDPSAALEKIEELKPELLLLDIEMPVKNGVQVLKEVREAYSSMHLPIIMLSASGADSVIVSALDLGANDFITKPIVPKVALARLQTQISLKKFYETNMDHRESEAIRAMVVTYNHEINNPLTVALGNLSKIKKELPDHPAVLKAEDSLLRIAGITKKIASLINSSEQKEIYIPGELKYKI
ncbi:MAG: response regulator [Pseudomonadota bacterium]